MKYFVIPGLMAFVAFAAPMANAQAPVTNVNVANHPNLAEAQRLTKRAFDKVVAAQQANEFDLGGHAEKARELLDQANTELKTAARFANHH